MNKQTEALKLALEVLEEINKLSIGENAICLPAEIDTAMDAIREALAEQPAPVAEPHKQQEPVAEIVEDDFSRQVIGIGRWHRLPNGTKLYTSPPASKPWVGLTDDDIAETCGFGEYTTTSTRITLTHVARAIESKLREKNA